MEPVYKIALIVSLVVMIAVAQLLRVAFLLEDKLDFRRDIRIGKHNIVPAVFWVLFSLMAFAVSWRVIVDSSI